MGGLDSSDDFAVFTSPWPLRQDPEIAAWRARLEALSQSSPSIRDASPIASDGRRMWDLQLLCPPITPMSVRANVDAIKTSRVLLAEVDETHIGLCVSSPGPILSDPLFVKVVAVAPQAQRRGVGLALLAAAAEGEPQRDIAVATRLGNHAALAMISRFATELGGNLRRVPLGTYRPRALGFNRGDGNRIWVIERLDAVHSTRKLKARATEGKSNGRVREV